MLQSWGRSTLRHLESSKRVSSAPATSPRKKRHPGSRDCSRRRVERGVTSEARAILTPRCPCSPEAGSANNGIAANPASPFNASRPLTLLESCSDSFIELTNQLLLVEGIHRQTHCPVSPLMNK